jgi:hypothetical protein
MALAFVVHGTEVGFHTPEGRWLNRAAFRALGPSYRILAYLAFVYPQARTHSTIARVCGIPIRNCSAHMQSALRADRIRRSARGWYVLSPHALQPVSGTQEETTA